MTRLAPVGENEDTNGVKEIFAEVRLALEIDEEPALIRMLGHSPTTLKGLWSFIQGTLVSGEGNVARTTKELIALAAASAAGAGHLCHLMLQTLTERGIDKSVLGDLVEKGETLRLPEHTRKILRFARRAALDPAMLKDEDFEELLKDGLSSSDIAELIGFSGLIACLIAVTRALGLTEMPEEKPP